MGDNDYVRLVSFLYKETHTPSLGVLVGNEIIDLCAGDSRIPLTMKAFLEGGQPMLDIVHELALSNKYITHEVSIRAPIQDPEKVICVGLNYRDHAKEIPGAVIPNDPIIFSKFPNAIIGPNEPIIKPSVSEQVDYEVELVVVIGKKGRNIPVEEALQYVAGYTIGNDVSARDWQFKQGGQFTLGKTFDTFAPIGPFLLVNPKLIHRNPSSSFNPNALSVKCFLNGQQVQSSNTREFIFTVEQVVSYLSKVMTLKPGDIIFTGTPGGVGVYRKPPLFMLPGDVVRCEIENLGELVNPVVAHDAM